MTSISRYLYRRRSRHERFECGQPRGTRCDSVNVNERLTRSGIRSPCKSRDLERQERQYDASCKRQRAPGRRLGHGERHDPRQALKWFQLYAGTHVAFARSYLYPAAVLRASFVVFIVSHPSPLLSVAWTLSNGTATCFSPTPRKPPTDTMKAVIFASLFTKTSLISPIFVSEGS